MVFIGKELKWLKFEVTLPVGGKKEFLADLVGEGGYYAQIPGGAEVFIAPPMTAGAGDGGTISAVVSDVVMFAVVVGRDVAVGLVSAWLYDKLKKPAVKEVSMNRRTVEVTEVGLVKIIETSIKEIKD